MVSFNRTIKELKLILQQVTAFFIYTFNRTIKELKFTGAGTSIGYVQPFNRTIKELKSPYSMPESLLTKLLIEPLRN